MILIIRLTSRVRIGVEVDVRAKVRVRIFWQLTMDSRSGVTGQSVTQRAVKFAHDSAPTLPHRMAV